MITLGHPDYTSGELKYFASIPLDYKKAWYIGMNILITNKTQTMYIKMQYDFSLPVWRQLLLFYPPGEMAMFCFRTNVAH